jgi:PhnB protein
VNAPHLVALVRAGARFEKGVLVERPGAESGREQQVAQDRAMMSGMSNAAGRPAISVMLIVSDAAAAVSWYTRALGADQLWDLGGVAGLDLDGAPFFLHEAVPGKKQEPSPTHVGLTTTRIEIFVEAPDDLIERAARAGASDVEPVTDHDAPWGTHRQGGFTDPFGHRWSVGDRTPLDRFPK